MILNPSFENYFDCPNVEGNFYLDNWKEVGGSCDFFHTCSSSSSPFYVEVPENWAGYQFPLTGSGYVGTAAYAIEVDDPDQTIREYYAGQLSEPLTIGTTYYVSAMVSLAENSTDAVNNLGFKFINEDLLDGPIFDNPIMDNTAHIYEDEIITDSTEWVMINGSFVADENYPYLAIGNFFDDVNIDTINIQGVSTIGNETSYFAYYYFDDVCVSAEPNVCYPLGNSTTDLDELNKISIFPNPTDQTIYFNNIQSIDQIKIVSVTGQVLVQTSTRTEIDVSDLATGIYFIHFRSKESKSWQTLKFVKE